MGVPMNLGFEGLELQPGEHLCGLYAGARQRDEILVPFLRAGLAAGDKCICIVDDTDSADIVAALNGPEGENTASGARQLDVMWAADVHRRSEKFSAAETIATWKAAISEVMCLGQFSCVRAVELWAHRDVVFEPNELLHFELEMRHYLALYPQVILCLYDIDRFGGELVSELIKLHSKVLIGSMVVENPLHLTLDELLASSLPNGYDGSSVR